MQVKYLEFSKLNKIPKEKHEKKIPLLNKNYINFSVRFSRSRYAFIASIFI